MATFSPYLCNCSAISKAITPPTHNPPRKARHCTTQITACRAEPDRVIVSIAALQKLTAWRRQFQERIDQGGKPCLSKIQPTSPPPRDRSAKRIELTRLWTVLPEAMQQKTLRCLARIVVGHLERREVHDDRR